MRRSPLWTVALALLGGLLPAQLAAQGSVGAQGFGYPIGPLSAGALGSASAGAELDPNSPLNPAAITNPTRYSLTLQLEPEYRRTSVGDSRATAGVVRFPAFQATGSFRRFVVAAGVSSFLDRAFQSTYTDSVLIAGVHEEVQVISSAKGGISDVRGAIGYVAHRRLQVGLSVHGVSGQQQLSLTHLFPDSSGIGTLSDTSRLKYVGAAVTLGIVAEPLDKVQVGLSYRSGGEMTLEDGGTRLGAAQVPDRLGVGIAITALPGVAFLARLDQIRWTDLEGLGTDQLSVFDATDLSVGADFLGPRVFGANSALRAGYRTRTLPFGVGSSEVRERIATAGVGLPVAEGRGQIDLALQRATREGGGANERAWVLTLGFGIRP